MLGVVGPRGIPSFLNLNKRALTPSETMSKLQSNVNKNEMLIEPSSREYIDHRISYIQLVINDFQKFKKLIFCFLIVFLFVFVFFQFCLLIFISSTPHQYNNVLLPWLLLLSQNHRRPMNENIDVVLLISTHNTLKKLCFFLFHPSIYQRCFCFLEIQKVLLKECVQP